MESFEFGTFLCDTEEISKTVKRCQSAVVVALTDAIASWWQSVAAEVVVFCACH